MLMENGRMSVFFVAISNPIEVTEQDTIN